MKREKLPVWLGAIAALSVVLLLCTAGCQDAVRAAVDPQILAQHRESLVLRDEPQNPQHVSTLVDELESSREVIVVGRPGGVQAPWETGLARFTLADCSQDGKQNHHHLDGDDSECPYCKAAREATNRWAIVEFQDADGKPIGVDARDLFGISQDSTVVVRGQATKDASGVLLVRAVGLFVRK